MMKSATDVMLESVLVATINLVAVYLATFTYRLSWFGVLTVMVVASLFTAGITHFIISKTIGIASRTQTMINESVGVAGVALVSIIVLLVILTQRFNFPEALGIAVLSGVLTAFLHHFISL